jgi:exosortase
MTIKPQSSWFPWLLFISATLYSAARYTLLNPYLGDSDEPLLFITLAAVLWIERKSILESLLSKSVGYPLYGLLLFSAGCIIYTAGRLSLMMLLEVWGLFIIAAGLVAALTPRNFLRSSYFIALSGTIVVIIGRVTPQFLSSELAVAIASVSASILNATILPIVSDGVLLYFGPYTAEVTVACSGMNSIFSLTALSLLYIGESKQRKPWHIIVLVLLVLPVAIMTNFTRVITLVLATWYVGDWFAQSIFHETAGVFAFIVALLILSLIDRLLFHTYSGLKPRGETTDANSKV